MPATMSVYLDWTGSDWSVRSLWWRSVVADRASLEWSLHDAPAHSDVPSLSSPSPLPLVYHRHSFATRGFLRPAVTGVVSLPAYVSSRRYQQCVADGRPRRVPSSPSSSLLRSIVREKETGKEKKKNEIRYGALDSVRLVRSDVTSIAQRESRFQTISGPLHGLGLLGDTTMIIHSDL